MNIRTTSYTYEDAGKTTIINNGETIVTIRNYSFKEEIETQYLTRDTEPNIVVNIFNPDNGNTMLYELYDIMPDRDRKLRSSAVYNPSNGELLYYVNYSLNSYTIYNKLNKNKTNIMYIYHILEEINIANGSLEYEYDENDNMICKKYIYDINEPNTYLYEKFSYIDNNKDLVYIENRNGDDKYRVDFNYLNVDNKYYKIENSINYTLLPEEDDNQTIECYLDKDYKQLLYSINILNGYLLTVELYKYNDSILNTITSAESNLEVDDIQEVKDTLNSEFKVIIDDLKNVPNKSKTIENLIDQVLRK